MSKYFQILFHFLYSTIGFAQLESSSYIILTNSNDSLRQIKGLATPISDSSGMNAQTFVSGNYFFGSINDTLIELDFFPDYNRLTIGMYFNLQFTSANSGNLYLKIDQLPPVQLLDNLQNPLAADNYTPFEIITVVFDGSHFVSLTVPKEKCPTGFTQVNENYCIQTNENTASNFYNAVLTCGNLNAELCSFTDWLNACNNVTTLMNMTDNYEWVNSASNNTNEFKVMGEDLSGVFGCNKTFTHITSTFNNFRCCYHLKK